ncbi:MAG: bifunctional aspartate kinase/homoserine dehydrogenase I [Flavobacteriaceae bacterium]|nr:bifunctional aspartate kinase/homoserine dehydrogenase I [Flavobacteriaceae bacterium]
MNVLKFGGTSVGSVENIKKVIEIVKSSSENDQVAVVVSAVGGITDKLMRASQKAIENDLNYKNDFNKLKEQHIEIMEGLLSGSTLTDTKDVILEKLSELERLLDGIFLINELSPKTTDKLLSFGELMSSLIIFEAMQEHGLNVQLKNSQNLIVTDSNFTNALVQFEETNANITSYFEHNKKLVTILPGFISKSEDGEITTLGRGGSDYTAAILAAALEADALEIWTDVSGMFTTNPKLVKQAQPIKKLSYKEAIELSHFGAKVLYPPTVLPVLSKNIPIHIKNTLKPEEEGTLITKVVANGNGNPIKGISNINGISLLTLQGNGMVGIPGFSKRLFETLAREKINVVITTQASSEHSICVGVSDQDAHLAKSTLDQEFENEISLLKIDPLVLEEHLSIVAVVGEKMKNHQGISGRMFSTLGKNNVNIRAIAQGASERNITAVITEKDVKKALNCLHETFFEVETKHINLFIAGVGNVGKSLLDQIHTQTEYVKENLKLKIKVVGLSNSKTMAFDADGIDLNFWDKTLANGTKTHPIEFFEKAKELNLRNSVFVDITANEAIAKTYEHYLEESIAVVACNKIACSSNIQYYERLKTLSRKYNAPFLFETNVGAGLPVIDTLNHLIASGDRIIAINAVLSGSLNFIFNNFNAENTFHDVVKTAQAEGYTEPDPRIDLSGIDVARKLLILIRESGESIEIEDIKNDSFLPKGALEAKNVAAFYELIKTKDSAFKALLNAAETKNARLKYVATYKDGLASVGLKEIPEDHPFYNLEGKDNIVMFYTNRYKDQPLIIKGAGAGAAVTASGLFADIIRASNI